MSRSHTASGLGALVPTTPLDLALLTDQTGPMSRAHAAAKAFEEALEEAIEDRSLPEDAPELQDPQDLGRRAASLAVSEAAWRKVLGPLLETGQAQALLTPVDRQDISDLARRGRLLVLPGLGGRKLYPAFQFSPDGRPYPEIAKILEIFRDVVETPYTIASWLLSPQDLLEGETPIAWLQAGKDSSQILAAAQRSAGELNL